MCVLLAKKSGVKIPDYDTLFACATANPDGFGFATAKKVYHSMDFDKFYRELSKVGQEEACIIHFRYATHGSICKRNCHPFVQGDIKFGHNGVLNIRPVGDMTDSETAFKYILMPVIKKYGLHSKELEKEVNEIIGHSKFAFLRGNEILSFGQFTDIDGVLYSNLRWRSYMNFNYRFAV